MTAQMVRVQQGSARLVASRVRNRSAQLFGASIVVMGGYSVYHLGRVATMTGPLTLVYATGILLLTFQIVAASREPIIRANTPRRIELGSMSVVALVPAYNEDAPALKRALHSLLYQTRPFQAICVVDDGSNAVDYTDVSHWFKAEAARLGIRGHWVRQDNGGKRTAQAAGVRLEPDADIYVTVDSDTIFDERAVAEAMHPFADPSVQSVVGHILVTNWNQNLLTRSQELWYNSWEMVERAALSRMGSVLVNSGPCAFYRGDVVRDNLRAYLSETLAGKPVHASDDSLLTLWALTRGRTIQQPTLFAFTLMPENLSFHRRQQLRWLRGSFLRSAWRFRELPLRRFAYWFHLARWIQYAAVTAVLAVLVTSGALFEWRTLAWCALVGMAVQFLMSLPYLTIRRSDQTARQRFGVFLLAPVVALWTATVIRLFRWYAMATYTNLTWGTRKGVEVTDESTQ